MTPSSAGFLQLAERFGQQLRQVADLDVRVPEDSALIGLAVDLVPKVTRRVRDGIELVRAVEANYDPAHAAEVSRPPPGDTLLHIGLMISAELATRDLVDVAYFARKELEDNLRRLVGAATGRGDTLNLASCCESALRCLRKALVSVESAIYEFEGEAAPKRQWFDVELSLQIRKLYWNLRRETEEAAGEDLDAERRLRKVLYRVVAFRELSVYPFLRVEDRVHLRDLLKRILDWLGSSQQQPAEARRIWQDLSAFTGLLVQISHRQELQDFDRDLLQLTYNRLFRRRDRPDEVPVTMFDQLESLLGLDPETDDLIIDRISYLEAWRKPLERLLLKLEQPSEPVAHIDLLGSMS
ncbi:MAG: hypothetical protein AAF725_02115 [Acidobacteriota bacterium]